MNNEELKLVENGKLKVESFIVMLNLFQHLLHRFRNKFGMTFHFPFFTFKLHKKAAFTLAEVLITLGIIGVVAAITMPTLIQNYKKHETTARLKKFNSVFEQAIIMSELDNGPSKDWQRTGDIKDNDGNLDLNANYIEQRRFFEKYLGKYMKYTKIEDGSTTEDENGNLIKNNVKIYFADGSTATLYNGGAFSIIYDCNGDRKPNVEGRDKFVWDINPGSWDNYLFYPNGKNYGTRRLRNDSTKTRETYKNECANSWVYCSRLLELDNWEFKNDYPYKL